MTCVCTGLHLCVLQAFLTDWRSGFYEHSKLANVLFAYELQVRELHVCEVVHI